jgi:hypothetical protein
LSSRLATTIPAITASVNTLQIAWSPLHGGKGMTALTTQICEGNVGGSKWGALSDAPETHRPAYGSVGPLHPKRSRLAGLP